MEQFSICIITKDEEENIAKCLAPLLSLNCEIIIVRSEERRVGKEC